MNLTPGELYFIGEDDPADGTRTSLVKIGIVKESQGRTAETRLEEHQTGNPRRLRLLHTQETPAVVRIERFLHAELAACRLGGEWFHLPGAELEVAIESALIRIEEAGANLSLLQAAKSFGERASNGQRLTPDAATLEKHCRLLDVRKQQGQAEGSEQQIKIALLEAAKDTKEGFPYVSELIRARSKVFDRNAFTKAHPDLAKRYTVEKRTVEKRFILEGLRSHESDIREDNPALFEHLAAILESLEAGNPASELHRQYLKLLALRAPLDWEAELLQAGLQAACQEFNEVAGVCNWKRREVTDCVLDMTAIKGELPDIHEEFSSTGRAVCVSVVAKDLGNRLPRE